MTELIITSSVLILVVILLRHFLKGKISLRLQYALWALVLLRLLVPLNLFSSPVSIMNFIPINGEGIEALTVNRQTVGSVTTDGDTAYYNLPQQGEEFTANDTAAENAGKFEISVSNRQTYIAPFLRLVWITGIVIVTAAILLSFLSNSEVASFISEPSTLKDWLMSLSAFLNSFSPSIPILRPKLSANLPPP